MTAPLALTNDQQLLFTTLKRIFSLPGITDKNSSPFEKYQQFRTLIIDIFFELEGEKNTLNISHLDKPVELFDKLAELGLIHTKYRDNIKQSLQMLVLYQKDKIKLQQELARVDANVRPRRNVEDNRTGKLKVLAGVLGYLLQHESMQGKDNGASTLNTRRFLGYIFPLNEKYIKQAVMEIREFDRNNPDEVPLADCVVACLMGYLVEQKFSLEELLQKAHHDHPHKRSQAVMNKTADCYARALCMLASGYIEVLADEWKQPSPIVRKFLPADMIQTLDRIATNRVTCTNERSVLMLAALYIFKHHMTDTWSLVNQLIEK